MVTTVHVQPVPAAAVPVKPDGIVSVTLTVPVVAAVPLLVTVIVKVAPICPGVKLPVWDFVIVRLGVPVGVTVAVSVAVPVVEPPPETVTVLAIVAGAFVATLTVNVIAG